jgi:hypothetical protein
MLTPIPEYKTVLGKHVQAADNTLTLARGAARYLDHIGINNHCWFVLQGAGRREVVKYTHYANYDDKQAPDVIDVDRAATPRCSFGCGDCVAYIWTGEAILQWLGQNAS